MEPAKFQPIPDIPALYIPKNHMLVIADIHIGIENELRELGVHVSSQTENMKKRLFEICETYHPTDILILGDVKHTIPSTPFHEKKEVYRFLDELHQWGTVHIVPGIKHLIPDHIHMHSSEGIVLNDIGFAHGHRWPNQKVMQASYIIIGHTHPTILLKDRLGFKNYEPCWLKGHVREKVLLQKYPTANKALQFLILPAFNPLCGGLAANEDGIMGPLSSVLDIDNAEVFLLDGAHLGKVKHILLEEK